MMNWIFCHIPRPFHRRSHVQISDAMVCDWPGLLSVVGSAATGWLHPDTSELKPGLTLCSLGRSFFAAPLLWGLWLSSVECAPLAKDAAGVRLLGASIRDKCKMRRQGQA